MTENLRNKCELFAENRALIAKKFMFEKSVMSITAGLIFAGADRKADAEELTECRRILNGHAGFFSEYRDTVRLALLSEMALSGDAEQYIENVKAVYKKLHKGHFRDNSYMVLAAMLICDLGKQDRADEIIEKHNGILREMEKQHPIITNSEDISYVILLALSDRTSDAILSDIHASADQLKAAFRHRIGSDSIQGISGLLALTDGDITEKCEKVIRLYETLKERDADIGDGYVFISLGTLAGIDESADFLADEILEADGFLKGIAGFDEKSMDKKHRLMFAVMLAAGSCGADTPMISSTFVSSALGIVRAKQIITMITVISNILPSVIGAVADRSKSETDEDEAQQTEQKDAENKAASD